MNHVDFEEAWVRFQQGTSDIVRYVEWVITAHYSVAVEAIPAVVDGVLVLIWQNVLAEHMKDGKHTGTTGADATRVVRSACEAVLRNRSVRRSEPRSGEWCAPGVGETTVTDADAHGITTEEAAKVLGVSRPHVVKLVESGKIPAWKVGPFRRMRLKDVEEYKEEAFRKAREACGKVTRLAEAEQPVGGVQEAATVD